jgi:ubiquinone/menaquinone biosynthesis C-methylase UbiE
MLQRHLHPWAEALDEAGYRVRVKGGSDRAANRAFDEGPTGDAGLDEVLRQAVGARLSAAGLQPVRETRLLDVCSGRGHLGEHVSIRYGARVTFADLSLAQLSELLSRGARDHRPVSACAADLLRLPYVDGSFDMVVGHSFLHHVPDVPAAVRELFRVVRPGGVVALLHEPNVNANFWESFPLSLLKNTDPREGFTDLWMFRPDDLRRLFANEGFTGIRLQGAGVLSGVVLNWWLLVLGKLNAGSAWPAKAAYHLRLRLNRLELAWRNGRGLERTPSLMLTARRPLPRSGGGDS